MFTDEVKEDLFKLAQGLGCYALLLVLIYWGSSGRLFGNLGSIAWLTIGTAVCFTGFGVVGHRIWLMVKSTSGRHFVRRSKMDTVTSGLLQMLGTAFVKLSDPRCVPSRRAALAVVGLGMRKLAQTGDMGSEARALVDSLGLNQGSQEADLAQAVQVIVFDLRVRVS